MIMILNVNLYIIQNSTVVSFFQSIVLFLFLGWLLLFLYTNKKKNTNNNNKKEINSINGLTGY